MHMVSHQAVGIQRKPADLLTIRKALQELFAVLVILKYDLAVNPTQHSMKNTAFTLFSGGPWHMTHPRQPL